MGLAFLLQVLYDAIGSMWPSYKTYGGIFIGCLILLGLVLLRPDR